MMEPKQVWPGKAIVVASLLLVLSVESAWAQVFDFDFQNRGFQSLSLEREENLGNIPELMKGLLLDLSLNNEKGQRLRNWDNRLPGKINVALVGVEFEKRVQPIPPPEKTERLMHHIFTSLLQRQAIRAISGVTQIKLSIVVIDSTNANCNTWARKIVQSKTNVHSRYLFILWDPSTASLPVEITKLANSFVTVDLGDPPKPKQELLSADSIKAHVPQQDEIKKVPTTPESPIWTEPAPPEANTRSEQRRVRPAQAPRGRNPAPSPSQGLLLKFRKEWKLTGIIVEDLRSHLRIRGSSSAEEISPGIDSSGVSIPSPYSREDRFEFEILKTSRIFQPDKRLVQRSRDMQFPFHELSEKEIEMPVVYSLLSRDVSSVLAQSLQEDVEKDVTLFARSRKISVYGGRYSVSVRDLVAGNLEAHMDANLGHAKVLAHPRSLSDTTKVGFSYSTTPTRVTTSRGISKSDRFDLRATLNGMIIQSFPFSEGETIYLTRPDKIPYAFEFAPELYKIVSKKLVGNQLILSVEPSYVTRNIRIALNDSVQLFGKTSEPRNLIFSTGRIRAEYDVGDNIKTTKNPYNKIELIDKDTEIWEIMRQPKTFAKDIVVELRRKVDPRELVINLSSRESRYPKSPIPVSVSGSGMRTKIDRDVTINGNGAKIALSWPRRTTQGDSIRISFANPFGYRVVGDKNWERQTYVSFEQWDGKKPFELELEMITSIPIVFADITADHMDRAMLVDRLSGIMATQSYGFLWISNGVERVFGGKDQFKEVIQSLSRLEAKSTDFYSELSTLVRRSKDNAIELHRTVPQYHFFLSGSTWRWIKDDSKTFSSRLKELGIEPSSVILYRFDETELDQFEGCTVMGLLSRHFIEKGR